MSDAHLNIQDLVTLVYSLVVVFGPQLDGGDVENAGNLYSADSGNQDGHLEFCGETDQSLQFLLVIVSAAHGVAE